MQTFLQFLAFGWAFIAVLIAGMAVFVNAKEGGRPVRQCIIGGALWPLIVFRPWVEQRRAAEVAAIQKTVFKDDDGTVWQVRTVVVRAGRVVRPGRTIHEGDMVVATRYNAWKRAVEVWWGIVPSDGAADLRCAGTPPVSTLSVLMKRASARARATMGFRD